MKKKVSRAISLISATALSLVLSGGLLLVLPGFDASSSSLLGPTAWAQSGGYGGNLGGIAIPTGTGLSDLPILEIVVTAMRFLLEVFLVLAVIAFVVTGIQFIIAMGNAYAQALNNARQNFINSVIALVVVGAGFILILTIDRLLHGEL